MFTDTLTLIVKIYTKCDLKTIQLKLPHKHFILYSGERVLRGNHNFAYQIDLLNITNSEKKKKIFCQSCWKLCEARDSKIELSRNYF